MEERLVQVALQENHQAAHQEVPQMMVSNLILTTLRLVCIRT